PVCYSVSPSPSTVSCTSLLRPPPSSPLFPYTTLFRSSPLNLTLPFDQITSCQNALLHPFQLQLALLHLLQILAPSFVAFFVHLLIQIACSFTPLPSYFYFKICLLTTIC